MLNRFKHIFHQRNIAIGPLLCFFLLWSPVSCLATEVIIVGSAELKPVADIFSGIRKSLKCAYTIYSPGEARGKLARIVAKENARTVVALGKDAIEESLQLPPSVAVVYGLVVMPIRTARPNTTGVYMATPVAEYLSVLRKYFPTLRRVCSIITPNTQNSLGSNGYSQVELRHAQNSFELVKALRQLGEMQALLLPPDLSILTPTAMEEAYLFSFRNKIPLLGVSEKHVKQGALLALVFDPVTVGKQLGEKAMESLSGVDISQTPPVPSRRFELYLNSETARKMGLSLSDELLRRAKVDYL
jgi:putative tryptophan/tyrosine transport system substrate-binding protein